jgi:hypothetical protein
VRAGRTSVTAVTDRNPVAVEAEEPVRSEPSVPGFRFTLDRTCWFPDPVLRLGPSDPVPFSELTRLVASCAFPRKRFVHDFTSY